jgi:hypothetical protein
VTSVIEREAVVATLKVYAGGQKKVLQESGWFDENVVAAGQLRQGKAPSMTAMLTGAALIEVLRPRRSKLLPRHFVLVATPTRVVALKASGGKPESAGDYEIRITEGEEASFPRDRVKLTDLPEGDQSKGGILEIESDDGVEQILVARPNLQGDRDTDELIGLLSG